MGLLKFRSLSKRTPRFLTVSFALSPFLLRRVAILHLSSFLPFYLLFFYGTVSQLLHHSKKVMGSIPAWGTVGFGGQFLPRVHSAQVGYLPGLSVWSLHVLPVFTRGFLH